MASRWCVVLDLAAVAVFVAIGRRSHDEPWGWGALQTLWPFLLGLLIGYAVLVVRQASPEPGWHRIWPAGVTVWASTLLVGMAGRLVTDQGTAAPFVVVATVFLALTLLGWRGVLVGLRGRPPRH